MSKYTCHKNKIMRNAYIVLIIITIVAVVKIYELTKKSQEKMPPRKPRNNASVANPLLNGYDNELLNLNNFRYLIKNTDCEKGNYKAVIFVQSHVTHVMLRQWQRRNIDKLKQWGLLRVFLLFRHRENFVNELIQQEQTVYKDLIQGSLEDTEENRNYKHLMGLYWSARYCYGAQYIIMMDDNIDLDDHDIKHNLFQNKSFIYSIKTINGFVFSNKKAGTDVQYAKSWMYFTKPTIAAALYKEAKRINYSTLHDIWITGTIRQQLNLNIDALPFWIDIGWEYSTCCERTLGKNSTWKHTKFGEITEFGEIIAMHAKCQVKECEEMYPSLAVIMF